MTFELQKIETGVPMAFLGRTKEKEQFEILIQTKNQIAFFEVATFLRSQAYFLLQEQS